MSSVPPTVSQLLSWPATVPLWPDAASALGLSRATAYELVRRDEFPCPVLRLGRLLKVPTAGLLQALGIPLPSTHDEAPAIAATAPGAHVVPLATTDQEANHARPA